MDTSRADADAAARAYERDRRAAQVLWPVVWSVLQALPALAWALIGALVRHLMGLKPDDGVVLRHADTARNRLLAKRLRETLTRQPPPTGWCAGGDLATLVPFLLFSPKDPPVARARRADTSPMDRGDAAAATWIVRGDEARRRRGRG